MKGSPEKILTFLKLSDCLLTVEHGQKINSYNLSHIEYPNIYIVVRLRVYHSFTMLPVSDCTGAAEWGELDKRICDNLGMFLDFIFVDFR